MRAVLWRRLPHMHTADRSDGPRWHCGRCDRWFSWEAQTVSKPDWVMRILVALFALCVAAVITGLIGQLVTRGRITTW